MRAGVVVSLIFLVSAAGLSSKDKPAKVSFQQMAMSMRDAFNCGGAGLDTRPWRMDLPSTLRWIEVDFQPILDYKLKALSQDAPKCAHQVVYADVIDPEDRTRIYGMVGNEPALMITEGLLMYLPADVVQAFGTDFPQHTGIRLWLFDLASVAVMRMVHSQGLEQIEKVRAEDHLTGIEITNMVRSTGWRLLDYASYVQAAAKFLAERIGPIPENLAGEGSPRKRSEWRLFVRGRLNRTVSRKNTSPRPPCDSRRLPVKDCVSKRRRFVKGQRPHRRK
jgi:hypothetical protein